MKSEFCVAQHRTAEVLLKLFNLSMYSPAFSLMQKTEWVTPGDSLLNTSSLFFMVSYVDGYAEILTSVCVPLESQEGLPFLLVHVCHEVHTQFVVECLSVARVDEPQVISVLVLRLQKQHDIVN